MEIKGTTTDEQIELASLLAANVRQRGWIVEVGCFRGRQTVALGEAKHPSVLLTCLDPFPVVTNIYSAYKYTEQEWKDNTKHLTNIEQVRGYSPINISNIAFTKQVDLVTIDMDDVADSLNFWKPFVHKGGKILVHTYNEGGIFPNIEEVVMEFVKKNPVFVVDNREYSVILTLVN
jgi:hypothetical protein